MEAFKCEICQVTFSRKFCLKRHITRTHNGVSKKPRIEVNNTNIESGTPKGSYKKSLIDVSDNGVEAGSSSIKRCDVCEENIPLSNWHLHIRTNNHKEKISVKGDDQFLIINQGFANRIQTLVYKNPNKKNLVTENFMREVLEALQPKIVSYLTIHSAIKFNLELLAYYVKVTESNDVETAVELKNFITKMTPIFNIDEFNDMFSYQIYDILKKMEEFQERDSGWTLTALHHLEININKYAPLKGSSYIPLPKKIAKRRACINVRNNDEYCFKWALISSLSPYQESNGGRTSVYRVDIQAPIIDLGEWKLNFSGLEFPLKPCDLYKFEANNDGISINVFGYNEKSDIVIGPYYKTEIIKDKHINLLFIQDEEATKSHYVWIKNISGLFSSQTNKRKKKLFYCNYCLQHFIKEDALEKHYSECNRKVSFLPKEPKNIIKFENLKNGMDVPFVVYADFECILQNIDSTPSESNGPSTTYTQEHVPCAFSYFIKCSFNDNLNKLRSYKGLDSPLKFVQLLVEDVKFLCRNYLNINKKMTPLTRKEKLDFKNNNICHICDKKIDSGVKKCKDHCHITGQYRGPAHSKCNIGYTLPNFIPIIFHNFSKYDCHLFVKELNEIDDGENPINVIPINKELYISLSKTIPIDEKNKIQLRFIDSLRFMSSSLDSLVKNLEKPDFKIVQSQFSNNDEFNLLLRKGVFPYDYLNSFSILEETSLPSRDNFFNKLTDTECSVEDYSHAKKVWNTFNCTTLSDYLMLYLKTDVLILTDVFESFRKVCKKIYKLDPCHYYTAPGLSWDAMLKITDVKLELFTDIDMVLFIQKGIRGGIVQCSQRYSKANNKYMSEFDPKLLSKYLTYLDANNLYGWAMSQLLPEGDFKWIENVQDINVESLLDSTPEDSNTGYILEVDLEYPSILHNKHNDLPFCAENKKTPHAKNSKLVLDLNDKDHYVIYYKNLQQCLKHGLKIKKTHRILQFKQSNWLEKYITLNNNHRTKAKNEFEKNFFKLLNNAVYGKTMENVDKRKEVKIISRWENDKKRLGARALIAKPNFHSVSVFKENMIAIQLEKTRSVYNKPIYLGFVILELSKWKMYDFHYDYMIPKYNNKMKLNYMDTDSFIYTIQTDDFYKDIKKDLEKRFDTSEYSENNRFNIPRMNKKVLGMMKDENNGVLMTEFIGLRSKMYSFTTENKQEIKKTKGVKRNVCDKLRVLDYKNSLFKVLIFYGDMHVFRSKKHTIYTAHLNKISLSYLDDKRFICKDKINTYAWGHVVLKKYDADNPIDPGISNNSDTSII